MTHACINCLSEGALMTIAARDGRRFIIDRREPQYRMGLLDLGTFEPAETKAVSAQIRFGFTIIDAGANFGWYTTLFSRLTGPSGQVHAFDKLTLKSSPTYRKWETRGRNQPHIVEWSSHVTALTQRHN
jgi:hypothetical protein